MAKFDREEAEAICGLLGVVIVSLRGFYRLDHYFTLLGGSHHYDYAYIDRLSRKKLYAAVADLIKHDLAAPAHIKWALSKMGVIKNGNIRWRNQTS